MPTFSKPWHLIDGDPLDYVVSKNLHRRHTLANFGAIALVTRIGLTRHQVRSHVDGRGQPLEELAIEVKATDKRSARYIEQYGRRCWEADILPAWVIEQTLDLEIRSWLGRKLWDRRDAEIERARALL